MDFVYRRRDPGAKKREQRLKELDELFQQLLLAANGDAERAIRWLKQVAARHDLFDGELDLEGFLAWLRERGMLERNASGAHALATGGEIALRRGALERIFASLRAGGAGDHRAPGTGGARERLAETRPFAFGDDVADLDWLTSIGNAVKRTGLDFALAEGDCEVFECEAQTSCATVIAIDVSHSMTLYGEDRITPAKQVALALVELIHTRFPKDELMVVLFGDQAVEVPIAKIPYVSNGPYHTNTREGLRLASRLLLRRKHPNRQIFLITDGKPSCLTLEDGSLYKNPFGLDEMVVNRTLEEAERLRRRDIVVTTFMLTEDPYLVDFVDQFTRANKGRAYFSGAEGLGGFVLVDYLRNRKARA